MYMDIAKDLLHFIDKSPSPFHVSNSMKTALIYNGFIELREEDSWKIEKGNNYVVTRGGTALIAFSVPNENAKSFHITVAHCDSPTFKVKENPEIKDKYYTRLNVESYGGMNMQSWMDRPLSVAGRVLVSHNGYVVPKLVNIEKTILTIPSLAIHMNRNLNQGQALKVQNDMLPLYGLSSSKKSFMDLVAETAKVNKNQILSHDLFLYCRVPGIIWGSEDEFISAPKLDDLQCAFATFRGFTTGKKEKHISVYTLYDNEEVGSTTAQGAGSTFLYNVLTRIANSLGLSYDESMAMTARSFMISADNGHAIHPSRMDVADPINRPELNKGIVIKYNAQQRYCTTGFSSAIFKNLCMENNIPTQIFTNNSNLAGGATLGNISNTQVAIPSVDIGLPQIAMHSAYETAGVKDTDYLVKAISAFFE